MAWEARDDEWDLAGLMVDSEISVPSSILRDLSAKLLMKVLGLHGKVRERVLYSMARRGRSRVAKTLPLEDRRTPPLSFEYTVSGG